MIIEVVKAPHAILPIAAHLHASGTAVLPVPANERVKVAVNRVATWSFGASVPASLLILVVVSRLLLLLLLMVGVLHAATPGPSAAAAVPATSPTRESSTLIMEAIVVAEGSATPPASRLAHLVMVTTAHLLTLVVTSAVALLEVLLVVLIPASMMVLLVIIFVVSSKIFCKQIRSLARHGTRATFTRFLELDCRFLDLRGHLLEKPVDEFSGPFVEELLEIGADRVHILIVADRLREHIFYYLRLRFDNRR